MEEIIIKAHLVIRGALEDLIRDMYFALKIKPKIRSEMQENCFHKIFFHIVSLVELNFAAYISRLVFRVMLNVECTGLDDVVRTCYGIREPSERRTNEH
jgi:hypothetical protein